MTKLNLIELANSDEIIKTGAKPKLPIKLAGLNEETLYVYRIPLEYLYFNNENGRIASGISRQDKEVTPSYDTENPKYNQVIEELIIQDNEAAIKKTKKSIKNSGQKVFGYVLSDGRVIDGNRRYTALRQLSRETGSTYYFEAVILPVNYDSKAARAEIKRLELAIQMGTEERESYDPVDLAVDIFQTVVVDNLMNEQDYAREANISVKEVQNRISTVNLMHDFLKFVNANNNAYHIVKDSKLYNPLHELAKKLNKLYPNKGPRYEESKEVSFGLLIKMIATGGDTVREIRDYFKDVLTTPAIEDYVEKVEDSVDNLRDSFEEKKIKSVTDLRIKIEENSKIIRDIQSAYEQVRNRQRRGEDVQSFIEQVKSAQLLLEEIRDGDGLTGNLRFTSFNEDQIRNLRDIMIKISINSKELKEIYEDEF